MIRERNLSNLAPEPEAAVILCGCGDGKVSQHDILITMFARHPAAHAAKFLPNRAAILRRAAPRRNGEFGV